MKHIPVHCHICNTDFDLLEDEHGYMGTCDCADVPTDPELEDTIFERMKQKHLIKEYFKKYEVLDYGDICDKSGINLKIVHELCGELEEEGIIGITDTRNHLTEKQRRKE